MKLRGWNDARLGGPQPTRHLPEFSKNLLLILTMNAREPYPSVMRSIISAIAITISAASSAAAQVSSPLVIGETFTIDSKVMHEVRRINVFRPTVYGDSIKEPLPVMYMPDGGMAEDFLHVAGLIEVGVSNGTMRPFMLVGIENTQRRRDTTGPTENPEDRKIAPQVGGSATFRDFIRTELMPAIKSRYRITSETAIVGESLAGLFVLETFLREPNLFDTYIAFDPSLWWNNGKLVSDSRSLLKGRQLKGKSLYIATSSNAGPELGAKLNSAVGASSASGLKWHYMTMPEETHATIYHPAALKAFRVLFKPSS
jgi:predicted alpha/beta superfamily hydrolase